MRSEQAIEIEIERERTEKKNESTKYKQQATRNKFLNQQKRAKRDVKWQLKGECKV